MAWDEMKKGQQRQGIEIDGDAWKNELFSWHASWQGISGYPKLGHHPKFETPTLA